jgi:hypothetical protein
MIGCKFLSPKTKAAQAFTCAAGVFAARASGSAVGAESL